MHLEQALSFASVALPKLAEVGMNMEREARFELANSEQPYREFFRLPFETRLRFFGCSSNAVRDHNHSGMSLVRALVVTMERG
jgi:hypothetical protein